MKIKYYLPLLCAGVITGCASMKLEGTNFDNYIQKNGVPINYYVMQNGNKLYFYKDICADKINWQGYNVEVTPENIIVKKTIIKNCPVADDTANKPKNVIEQRIETLSVEWMNAWDKKNKAFTDWNNAKNTKGITHPDTVALKQKYYDLSKKMEEIDADIDELKNHK